MTYTQMVRKINTAGAWFVGVFMGEFLHGYPQYHQDVASRTAFIQYIHQEYGVNLNYTYDSTKTKCYALMSLIENRMVIQALDHVLHCNETRIGKEPMENARKLKAAIQQGSVKLPQ